MAEPHQQLSGWEHAKEVAKRLQLRGVIAALLIFGTEKMAEHYIASFPDWGSDVVVVLIVCIGVYLIWTQPDVRDAILYIKQHLPRMLFPVLIITGAAIGGSVGAFGAWRIRHYRETEKDRGTSAAHATPSPSPFAPAGAIIAPSPEPSPSISAKDKQRDDRRRQLSKDLSYRKREQEREKRHLQLQRDLDYRKPL